MENKKTLLQKISVLLIVFCMVFSTTACSDQSYALKAGDSTLSLETYTYFYYKSYTEAFYKLAEQTGGNIEEFMKQTIEEKDVSTWMKDKATRSCKEMMESEKLFKDKGLSLSEDETNKAQQETDAFWNENGTQMEKFGISKDAYNQAQSLLTLKNRKLYENLFGTSSENPVSDEELIKYYKEYFTSFTLLAANPGSGVDSSANYGSGVDDDNSATETEDEMQQKKEAEEKAKTEMKAYVDSINNSSKTILEVAKTVKTGVTDEKQLLDVQTLDLDDSGFPDSITKTLKELEIGKAAFVEYNGISILLYKHNVSSYLPDLSNATVRENLLTEMKKDEFENKLEEIGKDMNIQVNDSAINSITPEKFKQS